MKQLLPILLIAVLCFCKTNDAAAQVNTSDSLALVDLYNSTDGPHWFNNSGWLKGPVWTWFGIYVENNRVTQIYFNYNNNLNGTLPPSLGNLSELYTLFIEFNDVSGKIPPSFAKLKNLITIDFEACKISGSLPSFLGDLTKLQTLSFRNNLLKDSIPSSLGNLPDLNTIQLDQNNLTGVIPSSFSNLKSLQILSLSKNKLRGKVPSLVNAKLTNLILSYNQFSGSIPDFHTSISMDELALDHNQFTGNVPDWFGTLVHSELIWADHNKLTGTLPSSLGNLYDTYFFFSANQLSGTLPVSLAHLPTYSTLMIDSNKFTFDGNEEILKLQPQFNFVYSPQSKIPINYIASGDYGKLSVHAGGTLSNNTYQWYRNNNLYKTITGDSTFTPDAAGVYFVKVNNSIVSGLQLVSDSITVVQACAAKPANDTAINIQATSVKLIWDASQGAIKYQVKYKAVGTSVFTTVSTKNTSVTITGLSASTAYQWKVRARCSLRYSDFIALKLFITVPGFATIKVEQSELEVADDFAVYPNPAKSVANIAFNPAKQSSYAITVYDLQGKSLVKKTGIANAGSNNLSLDIHALSRGTYIVKIQYDDKSAVCKLLKE